MKIIKPLYLNDKNLISYLLIPFTIFTTLINFRKTFLIKLIELVKIVKGFNKYEIKFLSFKYNGFIIFI